MDDTRTAVRTLRFTAKLSHCQHRRVDAVMGMQQELYNAGLEAWKTGYRMWGYNPSRNKPKFTLYDNCKELTQLRACDTEWESIDTRIGRGTLKRIDLAIKGFYNGQRGYPRFKARAR